MEISQLVLLATICFVAMISPGPDFLLVTKNALSYRRPQAFATAFGIIAGCLVHATYCILGLVLIIAKSILLFSAIKIAGGCYLMYLGVRALLAKSGPLVIGAAAASREVSTFAAFREGFLCNVLNPKLAIFLLSLFTQFIPVAATLQQKTLVASVFVTESALYWPTLVFLLKTSAVERVFSACHSTVDKVCGVMLLYLGARVAISRD